MIYEPIESLNSCFIWQARRWFRIFLLFVIFIVLLALSWECSWYWSITYPLWIILDYSIEAFSPYAVFITWKDLILWLSWYIFSEVFVYFFIFWHVQNCMLAFIAIKCAAVNHVFRVACILLYFLTCCMEQINKLGTLYIFYIYL